MAFKKKLPGGSHFDMDYGVKDEPVSSLTNAGHEHSNVFLESYLTNVNFKTDHAFDFESYKTKIVKGLEIFGEDITNLKSNMNHLFSITDFHVYKDFYDITNELVAIAQMKLEGLITKSGSDAKNYNEQDISDKILQRLNINNYRKDIKNHMTHLRESIAEFLNEDRNYRRTNFATSDLTLLLEKAFKLYDVFESESGLVNFLKVDELSLYNKMFQNQAEISYTDLITLHVPALTERLGPGRIYRTPAAFTKERLLFRMDEIINDKMPKITLTNISTFVKTQLLREKYNLKNNLIAIFQKVLPEGLKLTDDVEKIKKEILEELHALREGIAYLESHNKSYIKILTGNLHPDMIANLSFTTPNVDILIDIEKLFFIIDDITSRLAGVLKKIKSFRDLESESIENAVNKTVGQVTEHIDKLNKERSDAHGLIEAVFKELEELIEKERVTKQQYTSEKTRIDEERRELESNMEKKIEEKRHNIMETKGPGSYNIEASRAPVETREAHQYQPKREEERNVIKTEAYKPYESEKNAKVESNISKPKPAEVPAKKEEPKPSAYEPYNKTSTYDSYNKPSPYDAYNKPLTSSSATPAKEEKKPVTAAPAVEKESFGIGKTSPAHAASSGLGGGLKMPSSMEEKKPLSGGFGGMTSDKKVPSNTQIAGHLEDINKELKKDEIKKPDQKSKNFFDDIEDEIEDIDNIMQAQKPVSKTTLPPAKSVLPPVTKPEPVKEVPKKEEPKKEEKKGPAKWDFDDMEEDIIEDEPAYTPIKKAEPISKLPEPKKGGLEPLPALGGAGANKLGKLESLGAAKVEEKPAPAKTSAVDKLFNKLESAQDTKKQEEKKKDDDFDDNIDEDYDYEFDSDTEKKVSPKKESPVKPEPAKKDSPESKPAAQAPALNAVVVAEKLELVNEHIEQEAELFSQAIDPNALNDLDMLIMLFQEFFSQLKLFVFDYQETDLIVGETQEDIKGFKKSSVSKDNIQQIADALKGYYFEMLPSETQMHDNSRFFIPLAAQQEERLPFLVEVDIEHQAFTYMFFGDVPKDKDTDNFIKEFHGLLKDIINKIFDNKNTKKIDACTPHKIGLDQTSMATVGSFEGAAYIRVMIMIYYLVYETDKVSKNVTISIDAGVLNRFFCTLTSLVYLRRILEGNAWDQYSEYYLAMAEQLSDGQEVLVKCLPFESTGTDYPMVQKKVEKELQTIFTEVKGGLKEAFIAVDVVQPELKSVYYLYIASEFEPKVPKKDYKVILFSFTANDAEFDTKMEKIVKDLDKSGKTDIVIYKDYLRHTLNHQYPDVTLGSWIMLTKQNQFSPEESMLLLIYNMNGYHLNVQAEGEEGGTEGEDEANYGQAARGGPAGQQGGGEEDYENEDFDELPIDDIEDDF